MILLLISVIKASVVLVAVLLANVLLRNQSAALRHTVLAAGLFAAAVAPALPLVAPPLVVIVENQWGQQLLRATAPQPETIDSRIEVLPSANAGETIDEGPADATLEADTNGLQYQDTASNVESGPPSPEESVMAPIATPRGQWLAFITLERSAVFVWAAGMMFVLTQLLVGMVRLRRIRRNAVAVSEGVWRDVVTETAGRYGLRRRIQLIQSETPLLATWGIARPVLSIPAGAEDWPEERIRVAVYHELEHVRRGDWLVQMMAEATRVVYWFNPLFWMGCNRLAQESEQACDDAALRFGIREPDYAAELLELTRTLTPTGRRRPHVLSMASPSTIERRFRSILNPRLKRSAVTRLSIAAAGTACLAIAIPVVVIHFALPAVESAAIAALIPAAAPAAPAVVVPAVVEPATPALQGGAEEPLPEHPFIRRERLSPAEKGRIKVEGSRDSLEAFRSVGEFAGLRVYFQNGFLPSPLPPDFIVDEADVFAALDSLSQKTGNFWEVHDATTILVSPDNPANRNRMESQALTSIRMAGSGAAILPGIVSELRAKFGETRVASGTPTNTLVIRTTPENAVLAEQLVLSQKPASQSPSSWMTATTALTDFAGNVSTIDGGGLLKNVAESHAQLRPKQTTAITAQFQGKTREGFQLLADRAGIHVVFHRQFSQANLARVFAVENADIHKALDLLSFETGAIWRVLDSNTIIVATDNPTVRREIEPMFIKTFYVGNLRKQEEMTELVSALRGLISFNQIAVAARQNALMLRESAEKVALAERIVRIMDAPPGDPTLPSGRTLVGASIPSGVFSTPTDADTELLLQSRLQLQSAAPITAQIKQPPRQIYEELGRLAGINVVFHRQFPSAGSIDFNVESSSLFAALDRLSFQTGNFWVVYDPQTIIVATDNPTVRREIETMFIKTLQLKHSVDGPDVTQIVTALRTLLAFNQIGGISDTPSLTLRDTAGKIGLAEKIIARLDAAAPASAELPVPVDPGFKSGVFSAPMDSDARARWRSQLQLTSTGPFSLKAPSREAFELLGEAGGLDVTFHRQFSTTNSAVSVKNVDIITALDLLSFQSGSFWQISNERSIFVATDNPTVRREVEPMVTKTIELKNINTPEGVQQFVTLLRTVNMVNDITPMSSSISITDTRDKVALAERIAASVDLPSRAATR